MPGRARCARSTMARAPEVAWSRGRDLGIRDATGNGMPGSFVIDPGHGGTQQRGKSSAGGERLGGGVLEKDVNLALAQRVATFCGRAEITRPGDENRSIGERIDLARRTRAASFVSLHANPHASEVLVHDRANPQSMALASALVRVIASQGGAPVPEVRCAEVAVLSPDHHAPGTAACMLDLGYGACQLDDPRRLDDLARAIGQALERHAGGSVLQREPSWGRGTLQRANNDPPRQGRYRAPASNVNNAAPFTFTQMYVPNNELTFEFAAIGVEPTDPVDFQGPVDAEIIVALASHSDGTQLGQSSVRIVDQQRGYITFTGSVQDPFDTSCDYTVTVYNRINPNQGLILRMWTWV